MKINEIKPRINVDINFKVVEKLEERTTKDGTRVGEALVGDETGCVLMTIWEEQLDQVEEGKNFKLTNGYITLFKGSIRLTVGRSGTLEDSPEEIADVDQTQNLSDKKFPQPNRVGGSGGGYGGGGGGGRPNFKRNY